MSAGTALPAPGAMGSRLRTAQGVCAAAGEGEWTVCGSAAGTAGVVVAVTCTTTPRTSAVASEACRLRFLMILRQLTDLRRFHT